jgi:hypothetical protein
MIRRLRRQPSERLVITLQDGLELAIPSWRLDPLVCSHGSDAPVPSRRVEVLVSRRDLLDHQPLLHTAIPATPCVSQPQGAREAQASSSAPSGAGPRARRHPRRVAPAAHRPAPAVSRAPRPTVHRRQPQCPERGVSPCAPRVTRAIANVTPRSLSASPRAIKSAPSPRASGGNRPARIRPARGALPTSW